MKRRPLALDIYFGTMVAIALSFPLQIMILYGHSFAETGAVVAKLTFLNWVVIAGALICAAMAWRASPALKVAAPALIGLVTLNDFFVARFATDYSPASAWLATLGFVAMNGPLVLPRTRAILSHPEWRWWLTWPRKRAQIPVFIGGRRQVRFQGETFDISETGMFIPVHVHRREEIREIRVNETISVRLTLSLFSQIRCEGRVVRVVAASGNYPAGLGVEFVGLPWYQRRELRRYMSAR